MNDLNLVSKIARDKAGKRLGKIIRVFGSPTSKIIDQKPHVVIKVRKLILGKVTVAVLGDKVLKIKGRQVWFDIWKKDFNLRIRNYFAEMKVKAQAEKERKMPEEEYQKGTLREQAQILYMG